MKKFNSESGWAVIDKYSEIMPYNGAMGIWKTKFDADYEKLNYPKECGKLRVVQVTINPW